MTRSYRLQANRGGEDDDANGNGAQHDREGYSCRRVDFTDFTDRLVYLAVARDHEREHCDPKAEDDGCQRSEQKKMTAIQDGRSRREVR
jgi:hypothetical protein